MFVLDQCMHTVRQQHPDQGFLLLKLNHVPEESSYAFCFNKQGKPLYQLDARTAEVKCIMDDGVLQEPQEMDNFLTTAGFNSKQAEDWTTMCQVVAVSGQWLQDWLTVHDWIGQQKARLLQQQ